MENKTIVITSIYNEFWGTKHFRKSCERVGLPLHNAFKGNRFTGNGDVIRNIYEALKGLENEYKYAIYADGADSLFLRSFTPPDDCIIYSTEKAVWPNAPDMFEKWKHHYRFWEPNLPSPWAYLNGGGYCGPIQFLIEFFERYGLSKLKGDVNGQREQSEAFMKAFEDGFKIALDTQCLYFQTTGFEHEGDFQADENEFKNLITNTKPAILHGNGRTPMTHLYNLYNK
jgi:hypothetical protein